MKTNTNVRIVFCNQQLFRLRFLFTVRNSNPSKRTGITILALALIAVKRHFGISAIAMWVCRNEEAWQVYGNEYLGL
jgi:hypothetical protein